MKRSEFTRQRLIHIKEQLEGNFYDEYDNEVSIENQKIIDSHKLPKKHNLEDSMVNDLMDTSLTGL